MKLCEEQEKAKEIILNPTKKLFFLIGKAGSGKTAVIEEVKRQMEQEGRSYIATATTGKAANGIDGMTLHQALRLSNDWTNNLYRKQTDLGVFSQAELIIVEEASMLTQDVFCALMKSMKPNQRCLLVGDIAQLQGVYSEDKMKLLNVEEEYKRLPIFFDNMDELTTILLKENHRQAEDKEFADALNELALDGSIEKVDKLIKNRVKLSDKELAVKLVSDLKAAVKEKRLPVTCICSLKERCAQINDACIELLKKLKCTFQTYLSEIKEYAIPEEVLNSGDYELIESVVKMQKKYDESIPVKKELTICEGAYCMITVNETAGVGERRNYVNGTQCIVKKFTEDGVIVIPFVTVYEGTEKRVILDKDNEIELTKVTVEQYIYYKSPENHRPASFVYKSYTQLPLEPCYSITAHKSQGMTLPKVYIDPRHCFASGQLYVMLSRCTAADGITLLAPLEQKKNMVSPLIKLFYKFVEQEGRGFTRDERIYLMDKFQNIEKYQKFEREIREMKKSGKQLQSKISYWGLDTSYEFIGEKKEKRLLELMDKFEEIDGIIDPRKWNLLFKKAFLYKKNAEKYEYLYKSNVYPYITKSFFDTSYEHWVINKGKFPEDEIKRK